ncbi:MAG: 2-oxoacid:acceptor oxidoreductase family protein, partial [Alphaproteobacteria bacterium]|nr:2-oxoacid:acceptor oxidoreductase family protein [Alphaproteobacteria bacterium]
IKGVSAIVYVQTCAAEKRRRRKRGILPEPDTRVFINSDICEGCGDCGVQSNCVSIVPVETELGRKRAIDQSSCNKDYSCLKGFCPSFVTVRGGTLRKTEAADFALPDLPLPDLPQIDGTWNIVITGIGGTGAVTIGAGIAMAAHLDGKGAGMMEMAGLAQKGGAVHIHCRLGEAPGDISAIRVSTGEADLVIGGDIVTTAGSKTMGLITTGRTGAVINAHETMTGAFTRDTEFRIPTDELELALKSRLRERADFLDASRLSEALLGDTLYSNSVLLGAAWQRGLLPLSREAILRAMELNDAAPKRNQRAFEIGRWAVLHPDQAAQHMAANVTALPKTLDEKIAYRADHLALYQGPRLAKRYLKLVERFDDPSLKEAVAKGYHKVLAYKDEYEVARLLLQSRAKVAEQFEGEPALSYHLAPPIFGRTGPDGRPKKREFGARSERLFALLARMKGLRGTPFDPFGLSGERRMERKLIKTFEADMRRLLRAPAASRHAAIALAELPLSVRGFGPLKAANARAAERRRAELWAAIEGGDVPMGQAAE